MAAERERESGRRDEIVVARVPRKVFVSFESRVGLLCCLHVVEATIYLDDVRLCLCRVLCLFD